MTNSRIFASALQARLTGVKFYLKLCHLS